MTEGLALWGLRVWQRVEVVLQLLQELDLLLGLGEKARDLHWRSKYCRSECFHRLKAPQI